MYPGKIPTAYLRHHGTAPYICYNARRERMVLSVKGLSIYKSLGIKNQGTESPPFIQVKSKGRPLPSEWSSRRAGGHSLTYLYRPLRSSAPR